MKKLLFLILFLFISAATSHALWGAEPPVRFKLGFVDDLVRLYTYPNVPGKNENLDATILNWFNQSLRRDGYTAKGVTATVVVDGGAYFLELRGSRDKAPVLLGSTTLENFVTQFLKNGMTALHTVDALKREGKWDPNIRGWRLFLPLGLPMLNQRSLQFFHFPPERLLNYYQDYLQDPVPKRWEELLMANCVPANEVTLYEAIIDGAPIAAPDDAGPTIPIEAFGDYQRAQVRLLINPEQPLRTIPIVVYGVPAMATFERLFQVNLDVLVPQVAKNLYPYKETAVLGANHPYHFFAQAQIDPQKNRWVGSGQLGPGCRGAQILMVQDLIAACWQVAMANAPATNPGAQLNECTSTWTQPAKANQVCAYVRRQGSLKYDDPQGYKFSFPTSLDDAGKFCRVNNNDPCTGVAR